ncbi:hypothetical protein BRD03_01440 [Halobacteriales archaeon QS_9_68_17]|nr:MAG: hypothetical protein BRD03_01440 [Halobacteriales archaeon QS_9_68_17]
MSGDPSPFGASAVPSVAVDPSSWSDSPAPLRQPATAPASDAPPIRRAVRQEVGVVPDTCSSEDEALV